MPSPATAKLAIASRSDVTPAGRCSEISRCRCSPPVGEALVLRASKVGRERHWRPPGDIGTWEGASMPGQPEIDPRIPPSGVGCVECEQPAAGGSTCGAAPIAGTSAAAIRRLPSTPATTQPTPGIQSSEASSRTRTGSGATPRRSTPTARSWLRPTTTRWRSRCPDRPAVSRETGSATCTEVASRCGTDDVRPVRSGRARASSPRSMNDGES